MAKQRMVNNQLQTAGADAAGGAYTSIAELIRLRHAAKELPALSLNKSQNPLSGMLTSNFKGRGIDFAEVRQYEPGDDVRTIDWRVTARTQEPHTKLFQEERERPVMFLVDQSASMFFGSRKRFKSVLAAEIAALMAWSCLSHGDRVGGMVFDDSGHREVRPKRNKHSVLRFLFELHDFNSKLSRESKRSNGEHLANALLNVRRIAKHGFTIVVISDFSQMTDTAEKHLRQLCRHNDVMGVQISDQMEVELPKPDLYTITDGAQRVEINTALGKNREAYAQARATNQSHVAEQFARLKAPYLQMFTQDDISANLSALLGGPVKRG